MKILSIGNSFSQDAHRWLYDICKSVDIDVYNVNLYIGGCSLQSHWNKFCSDEEAYDYEVKACSKGKVALRNALKAEKWDVITFQQVSGDSGKYETYEPYLSDLFREVKAACPNAKFYIHKTWAYEIGSEHSGFVAYNNDQHEMYRCLSEANIKASQSIGAEIIPSGDIIQYLRDNTTEFDYKNGGLSLNRDGFHLSLGYGRFAAALTWYCKLFGGKASDICVVPNWAAETGSEADEKILNIIKNAVDTVIIGE